MPKFRAFDTMELFTNSCFGCFHVYSCYEMSILFKFYKDDWFYAPWAPHGRVIPNDHIFLFGFWNFNYVEGDLFLVDFITNLRFQIFLLGVVWDECRKFCRILHSKCPKGTCKFRAFEIFRNVGLFTKSYLRFIHAIKLPFLVNWPV